MAFGKTANKNARAADSDSEDELIENELNPTNVSKYQAAGEIASKVMSTVFAAGVEGATVLSLCTLGDSTILSLLKTVYTEDEKMSKGIAFPTCVCPTSIVCHLSPLVSDPEATIALKNGDMVRVELGVQIDGYIAQAAHTFVVGATKENPVVGRQADVIQAAYSAAELAARLIRPGNDSRMVTDSISKIAKEFNCIAVEGMTTHQVLRNILDGPKQIVLNPPETSRKNASNVVFEAGEVYSIDILVKSGEGKSRPLDTRTTVFKRSPNQTYQLKMQTSRIIFSEIRRNHGTMAFSLRNFENEKKARMGILECTSHNLVTPYPVLHEKNDIDNAHFMFTVLVLESEQIQTVTLPWDQELIKSECKVVDPELIEILSRPVKTGAASAE
ncbi:hypothetical protein O5D80_007416 [Batrachochytrium dendrobatidis]|nr:hypothetical protein O5D80_007416 [Batrachochytrium dendrobatidis]